MALHWNVEKVKDHDRICWEKRIVDGVEDDYLSVRTDSLIWGCLAVDLSGITEANAAEFWERISLWEKVVGASRGRDGQPVYFTKQDIIDHIGLYTNVSNKSRAHFVKKLSSVALEKLTGKRKISTTPVKGPLVADEVAAVTVNAGPVPADPA
jgi:hypothetical protein